MTSPTIDLRADLHDEDDDGRNWSVLADARDPASVREGALLVAGTERFWSVVRIQAVDADGQVHFDRLDEDEPAARELLEQMPEA